ncbi:sugar transferase [Ideonella sp. A 288]|uniref:sugar transferase n=1 Tax=Ideonella sp. A 288 TaxID=1962181 RepID=UPI000B4B8FC7|nr:sugar transferase [Ideonella sp. A 288]
MAKRLFDLLAAGLGLLLIAPLLLVVALVVRLDSPGPVFFRQERVGRHGRLFRIHKFRTMRVDAPSLGPAVTVGADPRITRAGRVLRHWRLDELPQFLDVLAGDMSLVGPRPEVPRYVAHYPEDLKARVLSVRPGLTDPAALAYIDEATLLAGAADPEAVYVREILPRKLAAQVAYADRATLATDVAVLWRTLRVLLGR